MRVIGVTEFGGPEQLRALEVPEPHAGPGEVRIRVHAAAVNPTDTVVRAGMHRNLPKLGGPFVPGMDGAGEISEVGEGVRWQVGEKVMAIVVPGGSHGAYADQVVVPAESVARIPEGADFVSAATLPMNGLTARAALDSLNLSPGQTLAVTGAAGAFGGYVVQLAKDDDLHVIADASAVDEQLVRDLGADEVVRRGADVADRIRELASDGVAGLADGSVQNEQVVPAVRDGGAIAVLRNWQGRPGRDITVHRVAVTERARDAAALDRLREQVESGAITLRVAKVLPAEQAAEAHRMLEAGGVRGRLVLDFSA